MATLAVIIGLIKSGWSGLVVLALTGPFWIRELSKARVRLGLFSLAKERLAADPADPVSITILVRMTANDGPMPKEKLSAKTVPKLVSTIADI